MPMLRGSGRSLAELPSCLHDQVKIWGSGFRVQDLGSRILVSRGLGLGFTVRGLRFGFR